MRFKLKLCSILFLLILFNLNFVSSIGITGETITGESITGNVTSQQVTLGIAVAAAPIPPLLTLTTPKNTTYFHNLSRPLMYTVYGEDYVFYNLDNTANITITEAPPIYFNTSNGLHTLYLYANNSYGLNGTTITFTVDVSIFTIIYDEYQTTEAGTTTNFNTYSYSEVQSLGDVTLEHAQYGKIVFNQEVNLTEDLDFSDNIINFSAYTEIGLNSIELDSTNLPNFDIPATLYLYNLSFTDPRILKDGDVCSSTICTINSYTAGAGGSLEFTVTGFSVYSSEETPTGGGTTTEGGGGGGIVKAKKFTVNPERIKVSLAQGSSTSKELTIKNTEGRILSFKISVSDNIEKFIKISEKEFKLNPQEEKTITLDFLARENTLPDLYVGSLKVKSGTTTKDIPIAIEIESAGPLFDVSLEIPKEFLYVLPGESLVAGLSIYNLGEIGKVDVKIEYMIKEAKTGKVIIQEEESVAVETQASFIKSFTIPENTNLGHYLLYIKTIYNGKVGSASAEFTIGTIPFWSTPIGKYFWIILVTIVIIVIIILYEFKKLRKHIGKHYIITRKQINKKKKKIATVPKLILTKKTLPKKKKVVSHVDEKGYLDLTE